MISIFLLDNRKRDTAFYIIDDKEVYEEEEEEEEDNCMFSFFVYISFDFLLNKTIKILLYLTLLKLLRFYSLTVTCVCKRIHTRTHYTGNTHILGSRYKNVRNSIGISN